jgi:antirestriction protein
MNEKHQPTPQSENQPDSGEQRDTEPKPSPAIYVASLADYNNGILHGAWIDAAQDPEDIQADIDAILASSREPNAEEWAIHDYEQFGRWRINEYDSVALVSRIAKGIRQHGYAFSAWLNIHESPPESFNGFHHSFLGHYNSVTDYVEQVADELGYTRELARLSQHLQSYVRIDFAAIARDMELSGEIATVNDPSGGMWIFRTDL